MRILFLVHISREQLSFYSKTTESIIHIFSDVPLKTVENLTLNELLMQYNVN